MGDDTYTESYHEGQVITPRAVTAPDGFIMTGWTPEVPYKMGGRDLVFTARLIPHTHTYAAVVSGSCTEGLVTVYTCSCGRSYSETAAPCEHNYTAHVVTIDETTTASIACSVCGDVYQEETVINYKAATSSRTNAKLYELTLTEENVTIQPDKTIVVKVALDEGALQRAEKLYAYRIEDGGKTKVNIEKDGAFAKLYLDHFSYYCITDTENDAPAFAEATCAFNGHSYTETVTAPTCTEDGFTTHTCGRCGDTYTDGETAKTGHVWGSWQTITPATCTTTGMEQRVCGNDNSHVEKRETAKTAHADVNADGICDSCGAEIGGGSQQSNCVCGKTHTGPFAGIVKFFHRIIYFFKNLFNR